MRHADEEHSFDMGDIVWFDHPHLDTAKRCPDPGCAAAQKTREGMSRHNKAFLLFLEAKCRPMVVVARLGGSQSHGSRRYQVLKVTSKRSAGSWRYVKLLDPSLYEGSVVDTGVLHALPENLSQEKLCKLDPLELKYIQRRVGTNLGYAPSQQPK